MNNKYIISLLFLAALTSCDNEENLNTLGKIDPADIPTVTLSDVPTSFTMVEEDMTIEIPVALSKEWGIDSEVFIEMISGSATLGEDLEITSARIENGDTQGVISIDIHIDDLPEEDETATFRIVASSNITLANSPEFTITLQNYVSPDLDVNIEWAANFFEESPDDLADYDVYIKNEGGTNVAGAETGGFEHLTLSGELPDGDYVLYAYLYETADLGDYGPIDLPITAVFSRSGVFSDLSLPQNPEDVLTNEDEGLEVNLAIITKQDGIYTIKTYDETDPIVIGGGRKASNTLPKEGTAKVK